MGSTSRFNLVDDHMLHVLVFKFSTAVGEVLRSCAVMIQSQQQAGTAIGFLRKRKATIDLSSELGGKQRSRRWGLQYTLMSRTVSVENHSAFQHHRTVAPSSLLFTTKSKMKRTYLAITAPALCA